jgi:UDP-N-acetylmuramyl tripeptide synthase
MKNEILSSGLSFLSSLIKAANLGNGSTWPGHIALKANPNFIKEIIQGRNIIPIVIAGTNGKTTTGRMLQTVLEEAKLQVFQNESGANLMSGIASSLILRAPKNEQTPTYAIFEVDENVLPKALKQLSPKLVILLDLFRDQLDRYGEVHTIAAKWKEAFMETAPSLHIIANGDDPQIVGICESLQQKISYFGLSDGTRGKTDHASDSIYCPRCGEKLIYNSVQFSHLGDWKCPSCKLKRPKTFSEKISLPLLGAYNAYNATATYLSAVNLGLDKKTIAEGLSRVSPAFGRQETFETDGRNIMLFLTKNPTGMNESLRTIRDRGGKHLLFILNDRIPDGRDISWIWDVDVETLLSKNADVHASGDRAYDMGLRLKYASPTVKHVDTYEHLDQAFQDILESVPKSETLYVLPTYSAMLEVRQLLTGRKIL